MLCLYHILFTHSSLDGNLGCIHVLATLNKTINICEQIFVWVYVFIFLGYYHGVELLGHRVNIFNHLRNCQTVFQSDCTILVSHQQCMRVLNSPHLFPHPSGYETVPHCDTECLSIYDIFFNFFQQCFIVFSVQGA